MVFPYASDLLIPVTYRRTFGMLFSVWMPLVALSSQPTVALTRYSGSLETRLSSRLETVMRLLPWLVLSRSIQPPGTYKLLFLPAGDVQQGDECSGSPSLSETPLMYTIFMSTVGNCTFSKHYKLYVYTE